MPTSRTLGFTFFYLFCIHASMGGIDQPRPDSLEVQQVLNRAMGFQNQNLDSMKSLGLKAYELSKAMGYTTGIAEAQLVIAESLWRSGKLWDGIDSCRQALDLARKYNLTSIEIRALTSLALIFNHQGDYSRALEYLQLALNLHSNSPDQTEQASILSSMAGVYANLKDYNQARNFWQRVLPVYEESGDSSRLASTWGNIGLSYANQGNIKQALTYYRKVLAVTSKDSRCARGYTEQNIGRLLYNLQQYDSASTFLTSALQVATECQDRILKVGIHIDMASVLQATNRLNEAIEHLTLAYSIAEESGLTREVSEITLALSGIYEKKGNLAEALKYNKIYVQLRDSLFNMENVMRVGNLEARFDYELREREQESKAKIIALEQEKKESRLIFYRDIALVITVLMLVITALIFGMFRRKRMSNIRLARLNDELSAQKNLISTQANELSMLNVQLGRLNLELEARVIERTRELVVRNAELKLKNDQLEAYAFMNSHKLRAPVASILGLTSLIEMEGIDASERDEIIARVRESTRVLDAIVREISRTLDEPDKTEFQ